MSTPELVRASVTVTVTLRWEDMPRCKPWYGARAEAVWFSLSARGNLPLVRDDVSVSGKGVYVRKDGSRGNQDADMKFGRLEYLPEPYADDLWAALQTACGES